MKYQVISFTRQDFRDGCCTPRQTDMAQNACIYTLQCCIYLSCVSLMIPLSFSGFLCRSFRIPHLMGTPTSMTAYIKYDQVHWCVRQEWLSGLIDVQDQSAHLPPSLTSSSDAVQASFSAYPFFFSLQARVLQARDLQTTRPHIEGEDARVINKRVDLCDVLLYIPWGGSSSIE